VTAICTYLYASARVEITATKVETEGETKAVWTDYQRVEVI